MKHRKTIAVLLGAALMFGTAGCELPLQNVALPRTSSNAKTGMEVRTSVPSVSPAQTKQGDAEKTLSAADEFSAKKPAEHTASSDANADATEGSMGSTAGL